MSFKGRPIFAEINLSALESNIKAIKELVRDKKIIAVVKDNAYGHGAKEVVKKIEKYTDFYGVACIEEATLLRKVTTKPFVIFGGVFRGEEVYLNKKEGIIPTVYDLETLTKICRSSIECDINIEIDTGMGRTGFLEDEIDKVISILSSSKDVRLWGLMTHFSSSDSDAEFTSLQLERFYKIYHRFRKNGINPDIIHVANSAGMFYETESFINAVRPGIMLYGGYPSDNLREEINISPVMTFTSSIISLKEVPKNSSISYGRTFTTKRKSIIATIACGYGDGYPRALSNKGVVYIKDKGTAPVVGRVCMDMLMIDVTDLKNVSVGDPVVLWGEGNEAVHPDNVAKLAGTISYELFCRVSDRIRRVYKGK